MFRLPTLRMYVQEQIVKEFFVYDQILFPGFEKKMCKCVLCV